MKQTYISCVLREPGVECMGIRKERLGDALHASACQDSPRPLDVGVLLPQPRSIWAIHPELQLGSVFHRALIWSGAVKKLDHDAVNLKDLVGP